MIFYSILAVLVISGLIMGYLQVIHFGNLTRGKVFSIVIFIFAILILVGIGHYLGWITQTLAAQFTIGIYTIFTGFFIGSGIQNIVKRKKAGAMEYVYRSFVTEILPNLMAVVIVAYGFYRTYLITDHLITGISITSGFSLVGFGFYGWTLRVVPEFRKNGVLLLDRFIPWDKVIAYEWQTEDALTLDYMIEDNVISDFTTSIPPEDQLNMERLLNHKIKEHKSDSDLNIPRNNHEHEVPGDF